jgi:RNA polymerase sigma-70 factor (ECF subfamily)
MSYSSWSAEELVRACVEAGNSEAWNEFVCRFRKLIACVVMRIARKYGESSPAIVDDLVQDVYLKVCSDNCRLLREFEPQHPDAFFGMLSVVAVNVAHDHFRARRSGKRGSGIFDSDLAEVDTFVPDTHSAGSAFIEREILLQEIDGVLGEIASPTAARDREIFWLYYRHGFTAKAIAAITYLNLTTKGVESILYRLTRYVRERLADNAPDTEKHKEHREGIHLPNTLNTEEGQP